MLLPNAVRSSSHINTFIYRALIGIWKYKFYSELNNSNSRISQFFQKLGTTGSYINGKVTNSDAFQSEYRTFAKNLRIQSWDFKKKKKKKELKTCLIGKLANFRFFLNKGLQKVQRIIIIKIFLDQAIRNFFLFQF